MVLSRMLAVGLALVSLPAAAVITMVQDESTLPIDAFDSPFFKLDDTPLEISGQGQASALFAGQGWDTVSRNGETWEIAVDLPTQGTGLTLMGQYAPSPTPPPPSLPLDPQQFQNVGSFTPSVSGKPRMGGLLNNLFTGVTSFLFQNNINTFSLTLLDSGINQGDDLGGPVSFAFFDRQGFLLQRLTLAKAEDKSFLFQSDLVNIAGLQITHQDPRGLEFVGLRFGVTPAPAPIALVLTGLAALGLARRPTRRQPDRIPGRLTPRRGPSPTPVP